MTALTQPSTPHRGIGGTDDAWTASLAGLLTVPAGCPDEQLDRPAALEMLRCGEVVLDRLIERGLPHTGNPGNELFNRADLFNLALYSGSRRSVPEMAVAFALRWMGAEPHELLAPACWSFSVEVTCPLGDTCGGDRRWQVARPQPELWGGRVLELDVWPDRAVDADGDIELAGGAGLGASAVLETAGTERQLVSPRITSLLDEYLVTHRRYMKLPPPAQWDYDRILPWGASTCYAASLYLERMLLAAGFRARTRRGWILGMLDLGHAWLEVEDDDGQTKVIDTVFALLAEQLAPSAHPQFAQLCIGSEMNRLLPTSHRADEPLVRHWCGGRERPARTRTEVRPRPNEKGGPHASN